MFQFLQLLTKRPTDKTIRMWKVIIGAMILATGYVAFYVQGLQLQDTLFGFQLTENGKTILQYVIIALGVIPMITGLFDINVLSRGYSRIAQIFYGFALVYISTLFEPTATINVTIFYFMLGAFIMLVGVTGKAITKKGLKTGQKITKIRV